MTTFSKRPPLIARRPGAWAPLALAAHLCLAGPLPAAGLALLAAMPATAAEPARGYDIPAGALGPALSRFAAEAGVLLSFDPALTRDLHSAGLRGRYTVAEGYATLLAGSGLVLQRLDDGRYVIVKASAATPADSPAERLTWLPQVRASARRESLGSTTLESDALQGTPGGNGDLTSLLRIVPGVQFDNSQLSSNTLGEISPANISINGGKFYDNRFLLDGASINNYIDPGNDNPASNASPSSSRSQGLAVDTSLLCKLTVMDSNIGAAYGGFSGGVIAAETCEPTRRLGGDVSVEHTQSSWTKFKIDPSEQAAFYQSATASDQPSFDKWFYRAMLEGRPAENLGLRLSVVRKRSEIPLAGYSSGLQSSVDDNTKVQTRSDDTLHLGGWWTLAPEVKAKFTLLHEPGDGRYFIQNARDSFYTIKTGGSQASGELSHPLGSHLDVRHEFDVGQQQTSRDSTSSVWKMWRYSSEKNWGNPSGYSYEGGYGDIDQVQGSSHYKLALDAKPLGWGQVVHRLSGGLELEHIDFRYDRKQAYEQYTVPTNTSTCELAAGGVDSTLCSTATPYNATSGGQFLSTRILYKAGRYDISDDQQGLFVQDEMRSGPWRLRLGLRYDNDNRAAASHLSPRLAGFWDLAGNGQTELELGANRYYSHNLFVYYNYAQRLSLQSGSQRRTLTNGLIGSWADPVYGSTGAMYHLGDLDVPHADELMAGIRHVAGDVAWSAKYVDRQGKDEVVMHLRDIGDIWWDNVGHSRAKTLALKAESTRPLQIGDSSTTFVLGADYLQTNSSHANYQDSLSSYAGDLTRIISWNGKFIRYVDRPADNYNRPWTLRLATTTKLPAWRLTVDSVVNLRGSYEKMTLADETVDYNGTEVDAYTKQRFGTAVTWDLRLNWSRPTVAGQEAYATLTIENVLNKTNTIEATSTSASYEKGRQFWLRLGYCF